MLGPVLPHPRFRAGRHRRLVVAKSTRVKIRRILPDCASVAPQRGEKAAQPIVGIPAVGSALYLVSPDRGRSWVRNLENDPHLVLDPGGDPRTAVAAEPAPGRPRGGRLPPIDACTLGTAGLPPRPRRGARGDHRPSRHHRRLPARRRSRPSRKVGVARRGSTQTVDARTFRTSPAVAVNRKGCTRHGDAESGAAAHAAALAHPCCPTQSTRPHRQPRRAHELIDMIRVAIEGVGWASFRLRQRVIPRLAEPRFLG